MGENRVPKSDKRAGVSSFPSSSLRFIDLRVSWDKGLFSSSYKEREIKEAKVS